MYRFATVLMFAVGVFGTATSPPCAGQEAPALPEGVTHVALPPGTLEMRHILKDGKPLLRLYVGKTVIHGRDLYLGDGKLATKYEAKKEGVHWAGPSGRKGFVFGSGFTHEPGSTIGVEGGHYWKVEQLKPGSVYVTTPSVKFEFKP
jgi:hypothetical protein